MIAPVTARWREQVAIELALWGLLGAAMFSGATLYVCLRDHLQVVVACLIEAVLGIFTGVGCAVAFTPSLTAHFHLTGHSDLVSTATVIGIVAYKTLPLLQGAAGKVLGILASPKATP